jgi:hypothetical protein
MRQRRIVSDSSRGTGTAPYWHARRVEALSFIGEPDVLRSFTRLFPRQIFHLPTCPLARRPASA